MNEPRVEATFFGAGPEPLPDPDSSRPRDDLDRTHVWVPAESGSWQECRECGMRDYFPGAADPCKLRRTRGKLVTLEQASEALGMSDEFCAWAYNELGIGRRPLDEWQAHWIDWNL